MRHLRWVVIAAGFALIGVLLAVALDQGSDNATSINDARDTNRALEKKLDEQETITAALLEQIRLLGQQPVVEPKNPPGSNKIIAIPGPRGPSCVEELGYPRCRGDKGDGGAQGKPGSPGANGERGADGTDGAPGKNGSDGKDGPPGPQGEQGPAGPAGTAQPGTYSCSDSQAIKSITVTEGGAVTLTCVDLPQFPGGGNQ